ncbi:purple acid phosphatase 13 [Striga asiatica]|uniref:Purple acid phosphatase 13 n=1 Tax=Striga asiatica TaxID=4170 RepID=A0A5A7PXD3_STRAF|nr:purple acid phosphatase 13 [Striga asiatica]
MDQKGERKEQQHPWLPPDYVSLAQLQERWLQKQRDKEMREKQKQEEMRKKPPEAEPSEDHKLKSGWDEKGASGRRGAKTGGRDGARAIADRGKGKETPIGGFENKTHHKKKKNRYGRIEKLEKGNEVEKEKLEIETDNDVNSGGVKEVLSAENRINRNDFRGRLSRNYKNLGTGDIARRENGVRLNKLGEGAEGSLKKGYSRNWENRRNHNYRFKEDGADVSKGNAVEKDSENQVRDDNLEFCSETGSLNGGKVKDEHVSDHGVEDEGLKSDEKAEGLVIAMENLKVDEKRGGFGIGYNRRYGNRRWNNGREFMSGLRSNNWNEKAGSVRRYGRFGRFEGNERKDREMNGTSEDVETELQVLISGCTSSKGIMSILIFEVAG